MTAPTPAIEARQFSKSFGQVEALAPLDLVVPHCAIFALVGQNGAGKTTLIKLLLNILQPTSGSATVLGDSTAALTGDSFQRIGYVSGGDQEMPDWMTVQAYMDFTFALSIPPGMMSISSPISTFLRIASSSIFPAACA